jgi:hypothetical protein
MLMLSDQKHMTFSVMGLQSDLGIKTQILPTMSMQSKRHADVRKIIRRVTASI